MTEKTTEQIAKDYSAMLDSVWLINAVINGEVLRGESVESKKECIKRNVDHLELMRSKDFWTSEDMTTVDAAIVAGKSFN